MGLEVITIIITLDKLLRYEMFLLHKGDHFSTKFIIRFFLILGHETIYFNGTQTNIFRDFLSSCPQK